MITTIYTRPDVELKQYHQNLIFSWQVNIGALEAHSHAACIHSNYGPYSLAWFILYWFLAHCHWLHTCWSVTESNVWHVNGHIIIYIWEGYVYIDYCACYMYNNIVVIYNCDFDQHDMYVAECMCRSQLVFLGIFWTSTESHKEHSTLSP